MPPSWSTPLQLNFPASRLCEAESNVFSFPDWGFLSDRSSVGCELFRDETYGDVKTSGNNVRVRILRGRNVLGRNALGVKYGAVTYGTVTYGAVSSLYLLCHAFERAHWTADAEFITTSSLVGPFLNWVNFIGRRYTIWHIFCAISVPCSRIALTLLLLLANNVKIILLLKWKLAKMGNHRVSASFGLSNKFVGKDSLTSGRPAQVR